MSGNQALPAYDVVSARVFDLNAQIWILYMIKYRHSSYHDQRVFNHPHRINIEIGCRRMWDKRVKIKTNTIYCTALTTKSSDPIN